MRNIKTDVLQFDPNIDKTERALRRAARIAREEAEQMILIQDHQTSQKWEIALA